MASQQLIDEVVGGDALSFGQIGRRYKKAPSTPARWHFDGVMIGGQRIKLEAMRLAGRWVSSLAAVKRFLNAVNGSEALVEDGDFVERASVAGAKLEEMLGK